LRLQILVDPSELLLASRKGKWMEWIPRKIIGARRRG
jgi:hypothetical protein